MSKKKILALTACPVGVAHTYNVKVFEKIGTWFRTTFKKSNKKNKKLTSKKDSHKKQFTFLTQEKQLLKQSLLLKG